MLYGLTSWSFSTWYKAIYEETTYPCLLTIASLDDSNHFLIWYETTPNRA